MVRTKIGSNASFVAPNKGLSIVGDHCYATSGLIDLGSEGVGTEIDLLNFTTGTGYLVINVQFHYGEISTEDYQYKIYFNGSVVVQYVVGDRVGEQPDNVVPLVIPPLTKVQFTAANMTANNNRIQSCTLTGRVYDA